MTDPARPTRPVICPRCGAENQRNRFFCEQCDAYIRPQSRDRELNPTVPPHAPVGAPASTALAPDEAIHPAPARRARLARYAPLLVLVAVLALIAVAVLATLRPFGEEVASSTSSVTTAAGAAGGSTTTLVATVGTGTSASPATTIGPTTTTFLPTTTTLGPTTTTTKPPQPLPPTSVDASSQLPADGAITYGPDNLIDGNLSTAWNEGTPGTGEGQSVSFRYDRKVEVTGLRIANGYQKSDATFAGNLRVRTLRVSFSDSDPVVVSLKETKGFQDITFSHPYVITSLRLTILATYPTHTWDDAALSEVQLVGYPVK